MKKNVLIIGAGAVGSVVTHKCAQNSHVFGSVCLASRKLASCLSILSSVEAKNHKHDGAFHLSARTVDASDSAQVARLIRETGSNIIINVCTAFVNMAVMDACLETGAAYIDTAVHEDPTVMNAPYPWYANFEWKKKAEFARKKVTAILGAGFDPGVVNAYCAYAQHHEFDSITSIDIMDVNDGCHGRFFSTNFDPEINLREVIEDAGCLEEGEWRTFPHHSREMKYEFPEVGEHKLYLMGHDEVHSLSKHIPGVETVRFWMGFGEHSLRCLEVFEKTGLLNHEKVTTSCGQSVVPLHVLKACLPNPSSLAPDYTGKTCIGTLIKGLNKDEEKEVFIYNICSHEEAFADVGSQAIAFTAGVPPVAAAILIAQGEWDVKGMANIEELPPLPFLKLLARLGLPTAIRKDMAVDASKEDELIPI